MGLARQDQGARRRRCRGTSLTTSNADIASQPLCGWAATQTQIPSGSGGAGASAALALLDDVHRHRLRRAALQLPQRRSERGPAQFSDRLLEAHPEMPF